MTDFGAIVTGRDGSSVAGRGPVTVTMGERKRESASLQQRTGRHHHSVDDVSQPQATALTAVAAAGGGAGGDGGDATDSDRVRLRDRDRDRDSDRDRDRERQSAFLNRDTDGKPNRFGWRSWSSHRLSDLSAKKVLDWLREPSSSEYRPAARLTGGLLYPSG